MNQISLGKTGLLSSEIALGCMKMAEVSAKSAIDVIQSAYQSGITLFDHADIYGAVNLKQYLQKLLTILREQARYIILVSVIKKHNNASGMV